MKKTNKSILFLMITFIAVQFAYSSMPVTPQVVEILQSAEQMKETISSDLKGYVMRNGEKVLAENAQPGEIITWEITLRNNISQPVNNIRIDGNIPDQTIFVKNSAANVEYSLDRQTFSRNPTVRDDKGNLVAAPSSRIKAIRFTVSLQGSETKTLTYKTTVK